MNKTFFARFALPILMLVFFTVPFALRGARMSFTTMKNDVKDWLPADFEETKDLDWFRDNFLGEQFVLVTWPGCTADDTRFKLLVEKLRSEIPQEHRRPLAMATSADEGEDTVDPAGAAAVSDAQAARERDLERSRQLGDRLGLSLASHYFENWGGRGEKWLVGDKEVWYFITPEGELYRWNGGNNLLGWASRKFEKLTKGINTAEGELIATLGKKPTDDQPNEYHNDPRKATARFFKTVTTGPEVFARMAGPEGGLWPRGDYSDEEKREIAEKLTHERLSGSLFGPDGKQTCLIITLSDVARRELKRALGRELMGKPPGRLLQVASEAGLSYEDLKLGGPPVDNVAIDEEGSITLVRLIGWSLALGAGLAYLSFRSIKITIMIFFVGGVSAIISLSLVWYSGDHVDAIVMSMPSLVYVLALTSAVHMITYYRHHCHEHGLEGAAEATILHTWKPLLLAQLTSAIGLISLLTSELSPIRKFGLYASLGTLATLVVMYLYLPSALQLWPPGYHKRRTGESSALDQWMHTFSQKVWGGFSGFIVRNHYWIAPAVFIFVCVMAYGTTKLKTNVQLLKMFDADSKIIKDYAWMEQNLGRLVPMEMVVRVAPEIAAPLTDAAESEEKNTSTDLKSQLVQYNFLERMELAEHVQNAIEGRFGPSGSNILGRGMSAVTFAPPLPGPGYGWRSSRAVFNRKLEQHRAELLTSDYLRIDKADDHAGAELWRISLRLGALNNVDYGEFVNDLKCVVEPVLSACRHREAVLASLAKSRPEQGVVGARVAVIGVSDPASYLKAEQEDAPMPMATRPKIRNVSATPRDAVGVKADKREAYAQDQARLFSETLTDLLGNRGFKTASNAKSKLDFIDSKALTSDGKPLSPDALATKLASYDCVVLAQELPGCSWSQVEQLASHVVDARDFRFDPYSTKPEPTAAKRNDPIQAIYTGVVPVVYKAQRELLDSLVTSTNYAFVSIALCMMILLRSGRWKLTNLLNFRGGFVAMLPNIFPLIVVFGAIGYLGVEVDIGSMMTASIAIGVAVDDTIHYLEWFRNGMKSGMTRRESIIAGYQHSGSAIIETMLIGGLGLSVFAFSTFTPTQRFGTLMLTMLAVGAIGELVWMPALLAGPLGKYFEPQDVTPTPSAPALAVASEAAPELPAKMQHDAPHTSHNVVRRDKAH